MNHNKIWAINELLEGSKSIGCNESLRPNVTLMTILNDTKLDLLSKVSLRKLMLTIKRPFLLSQKKTH